MDNQNKRLGYNWIFYLIMTCLLLLIVVLFAVDASALVPSKDSVYSLQGQEIIAYTSDTITLANGTHILIDAANTTKYLSQITESPKQSDVSIFYSDETNYAVDLISEGNYSVWDPANATRIQQGGCVKLGDTVDIAGIGWYSGYISYYGKYYSGYTTDENISIVAVKRVEARNLTKYYIDPSYFFQYPGWWYIYYPDDNTGSETTGQHGYDRIFYIGDSCKVPNETIAEKSIVDVEAMYKVKEFNLSSLPEKKEFGADYIVSRNETTVLPAPYGSHAWVFGRVDGIYDWPVISDSFVITTEDTHNIETGSYDFLYTIPDAIGLFEQEYDHDTKSITSPLAAVPSLYIGDLQPREVESRFLNLVYSSHQILGRKYAVVVQEPSIEIMKMDQWQGYNNKTLITIAGYTNANVNDSIHIQMDSDTMGDWHEITSHTWETRAWGNLSAYRYWNTTFIYDVQDEAKGPHSITVTNDAGAKAVAPFYVYRELPAHYVPENYIQYVNNSPFIPPVIVTVTVPVPGPTEIVYQQIPPSQEQISTAAQAIVDKQNARNTETFATIVIIVALALIGVWVWSAYLRTKP